MPTKNLQEHPDIKRSMVGLKRTMINYMPHANYSKDAVDECLALLAEFIEQIVITSSKKEAKTLVKAIVLLLNELNKENGEELIETDQREDICTVIMVATKEMGYTEEREDLTFEWREW